MGLTNQNGESTDNQKKLFKINRKKIIEKQLLDTIKQSNVHVLSQRRGKGTEKNI